jgi:hypothetical protein
MGTEWSKQIKRCLYIDGISIRFTKNQTKGLKVSFPNQAMEYGAFFSAPVCVLELQVLLL